MSKADGVVSINSDMAQLGMLTLTVKPLELTVRLSFGNQSLIVGYLAGAGPDLTLPNDFRRV